ncbi:TPA: hypothetical protein N0F65_011830 [Lagenidium giganteum]|uniref:Globin domain-containing protein n=1 Tax=Lagenidium giganteum TaxID=4803 RepID=A0AAV2YXV6_9STRA|nr:TPA: hypothetical protein N0F65_011830 [Lagenidium giganteum]
MPSLNDHSACAAPWAPHTHISHVLPFRDGNGSEDAGARYSARARRLMAQQLPSFPQTHQSTKADHDILPAYWDKLFAQTMTCETNNATTSSPMVVLFDSFYTYLFELAPQTRPLFRSSMKVQGKALVRLVEAIKNLLQSPNAAEAIASLAHSHVKNGIKLEYFDVTGVVLMKTLATCSQELWTSETEAAWRKPWRNK